MLHFVSFPEPAVFKNNRSSLSHAEFVEEAIQDLIESVRIVETNELPRGADIFSFDLKIGYHHVESFEGHQTYLVFFLEAFQFQSCEVLSVYSFTFRIIVRPPHVQKHS